MPVTATGLRLSGGQPLADDPALHAQIEGYFGPRAGAVDAAAASLRDGLAWLGSANLCEMGIYGRDAGDFSRMCHVDATVASVDMSSGFALWCHRMAIEYLHQADDDCPLPGTLLPRLRRAEVIGSTSFASATANYLAGSPLPLQFERDGEEIIVSGRIPWASNIEPPFVSVAAAAAADDPTDRLVFAFAGGNEGFVAGSYPDLLALQATKSTSPKFERARISAAAILTADFPDFFERVFPTFVLIQCSFCWGLAHRSLAVAEPLLDGPRVVLKGDFDELADRFEHAVEKLCQFAASSDRRTLDHRALLELRLFWGQLAPAAVALEAKLVGGRGYMRNAPTARRVREAAFLPIQAPTEVQLRWLLTH